MRGRSERQVPLRNGGESGALPDLLRQSLRRVLTDTRYSTSDDAKLRVALRGVCERARTDGVRAEHLLIVLKESWRDLPERRALQSYEADDALARVIRACIDEYYREYSKLEPDSLSPGAEVQ